MGYQTNYTLTTKFMIAGKPAELKDDAPLNDVIKQLRKENEEASYSLTETGRCSGNDSRWYEHEKDLKEFSVKHPSVLFTLNGEGEEASDQWNKYFLNGKCQIAKAEIQIAPFDPTKLR